MKKIATFSVLFLIFFSLSFILYQNCTKLAPLSTFPSNAREKIDFTGAIESTETNLKELETKAATSEGIDRDDLNIKTAPHGRLKPTYQLPEENIYVPNSTSIIEKNNTERNPSSNKYKNDLPDPSKKKLQISTEQIEKQLPIDSN